MKAGTNDALDEALNALLVLSDRSRAWGYPPSRGMHVFARGAAQRVRRIRDGGPPVVEINSSDALSVIYTHREHAERSLEVFTGRGVKAKVVEATTKGGRKGFAVVSA